MSETKVLKIAIAMTLVTVGPTSAFMIQKGFNFWVTFAVGLVIATIVSIASAVLFYD